MTDYTNNEPTGIIDIDAVKFVQCPKCNSDPTVKCVNPNGRSRRVHVARIKYLKENYPNIIEYTKFLPFYNQTINYMPGISAGVNTGKSIFFSDTSFAHQYLCNPSSVWGTSAATPIFNTYVAQEKIASDVLFDSYNPSIVFESTKNFLIKRLTEEQQFKIVPSEIKFDITTEGTSFVVKAVCNVPVIKPVEHTTINLNLSNINE